MMSNTGKLFCSWKWKVRGECFQSIVYTNIGVLKERSVCCFIKQTI